MKPTKRDKSTDRGVSPVIGVILMVAITVILAAVIGTFVLDLGSDVNDNARAGVSFDQTNSTSVDITLTTLGNVDGAGKISFNSAECSFTDTFSTVGDTVTATCNNGAGDKISVIATKQGSDNVIATYTLG